MLGARVIPSPWTTPFGMLILRASFGIILVISSSPCQAANLLFESVSEAESLSSTPRSEVLRHRPVRIAFEALAPGATASVDLIEFNLFDDAAFQGIVERMTLRGAGQSILSGRLRGFANSSFTLVKQGDVLIGNIRNGTGKSFQVRFLTGGIHEIREIDESAFPPCATDEGDKDAHGHAGASHLVAAGVCDDDGSIIDLMVVYTEQARQVQGGTVAMEALIALSEFETNDAYENSLIGTSSVRVVLTYEADYEESGSSSTDRARLSNPSDGFMDEIHDLRNIYAADVVTLIVDGFEVCGRAYFSISAGNVPHPELGFNVVQASCSAGNYTFGHELGHNQGCRHDRGSDPSNDGAYLYSHGYKEPSGLFRTVMGTSDNSPRIRYFSNPSVLFQGVPTGIPDGQPSSADNALTIINTAFNVANFRRSSDCNNNGLCDVDEIAAGTAIDCNGNDRPDECDDDCNGNGVADECDISEGTSPDCDADGLPDECELECNGNGIPDSCDILQGISEDCTGNGIPDECEPDCNVNGVADSCDVADATSEDANGNDRPDECEPPILFVNAAAVGANNGTSWTNAFVRLEDSLILAGDSAGRVREIWVAAGTYRPEGPGGDRTLSFELVDDVALYGGFAGDETDLSQRNAAINQSILSGDLNGDDGPSFVNNDDNSFHIMVATNVGAATIVDGFTFTAGNADGSAPYNSGGGIRIDNASPTITNCIFQSNDAFTSGAGILVRTSDGGSSEPRIDRCRFLQNNAAVEGAAIGTFFVGANPLITNSVFTGNTANFGGALFLSAQSDSVYRNCTFTENEGRNQAVVYIAATTKAAFDSCNFWANSGFLMKVTDPAATVQISFCNFTGGLSGIDVPTPSPVIWGQGNFDADPLLDSDGVHLLPGSPCIGRGAPNRDPSELDIDGEPRVQECRVDVGADETSIALGLDCDQDGLVDACEIISNPEIDCDANGIPDVCDISATSGAPGGPFYCLSQCDPDCNENGRPDVCDVADAIETDCNQNALLDACEIDQSSGAPGGPFFCASDCDPDCNTNGIPDDCDLMNPDLDLNGNGVIDVCGGEFAVLYVDASLCPVVGTGTEIDPFCSLYDAVDAAGVGGILTEIIIADGYYALSTGGLDFTGRSMILRSVNGPTSCIIDSQQRGYSTLKLTNGEHVVFDGLTITGGKTGKGGGVYVVGSNATLRSCIIEANQGLDRAGGVYCEDGTVAIQDCQFLQNQAAGTTAVGGAIVLTDCVGTIIDSAFNDNMASSVGNLGGNGGGIYVEGGSLSISETTFTNNTAGLDATSGGSDRGGALYLDDVSAVVSECRFGANLARRGGGAYVKSGSVSFDRCVIESNSSVDGSGGGAAIESSLATLTNCTIRSNTSTGSGTGGGLYVLGPGGQTHVVQSLIVDNSASSGGAIDSARSFTSVTLTVIGSMIYGNLSAVGGGGGIRFGSGSSSGSHFLNLSNTIVWGNTGTGLPEENQLLEACGSGTCTENINYNAIEGWTGVLDGIGNIGSHPLFFDPDGDDDVLGTDDDDFHVFAGSPCIDSGDNEAVPFSLLTDFEGALRFRDDPSMPNVGNGFGPIVDMGLYEGGVDCNGNGVPDSEDIVGGTSLDCTGNGYPDECEPDCNSNGFADSCDIDDGSSQDCTGNGTPDECEPDCNESGTADSCDIATGTSEDCNNNGIPDECDIGSGTSDDCDENLEPDVCQADLDDDGVIDACDGCALDPNKSEPGLCGCGVADSDSDADTIPDCHDLCPGFDDRDDSDNDGVPDACDACPGFDDASDADFDTVPDACDLCPGGDDRFDSDEDTIPNACDICPNADDLADADGDGVPDGCDVCPGFDDAVDTDQDNVPNGCDQCEGVDDAIDGDNDLVPDACDQCDGFDDLLDCNLNANPDGCDIRDALSVDSNANGIPDECDAPVGYSLGPRYIGWIAPVGGDPVALRIYGSPDTCIDHYVDFDANPALAAEGIGGLVVGPVFRSPAEWGSLAVRDALIVPGVELTLEMETQFPAGTLISDGLSITAYKWGDVNGDGNANFADITLTVDAFRGVTSSTIRRAADLWPCLPDGAVKFDDITFSVDAFKDVSFPCVDPCP